MKKYIIGLLSIFVIVLIIIIICKPPKSGTLKCIYTSTSDVINTESVYIVKYKNNVVTNLKTKEIIEIADDDTLEKYKTSLELTYGKYSNLKYYDNEITLKDNTLTTITNINYEKLDIDEFIKIDEQNRSLFDNKKIKLKTIKKIYVNNGAKCKYI